MDKIVPTKRTEVLTSDGLALFNGAMRNGWLNQPIRKVFSCHAAGIEGTGITLLGGGPPAFTEINTSDITAIRFATGNTMMVLWTIPADCDLSKDLGLRVVSSNKVNTGGTIGYGITYRAIPLGGAVAIAATPAGVFNTVAVPRVAHTTAYAPKEHGWNVLSGNVLAALTPGLDYLQLMLTCTLTVLADDDLWELQYTQSSKYIGGGAF